MYACLHFTTVNCYVNTEVNFYTHSTIAHETNGVIQAMLSKQTRMIYQNVAQSELEACLRGIVKHHRIQGSPGYHDAAVFCRDRLLENGISSAEILEYPAKEGVYFQNAPSFDFWTCRRAWCKLTQTGEMLADFAEQPFSIIQRSGPWLD